MRDLTDEAALQIADEIVDLLKTFASQSALAIQNARLFREIANKSRRKIGITAVAEYNAKPRTNASAGPPAA